MWSISWLFVLEAVVIVIGNVITMVIFTSTPRLRSRQYVLIVNLAVADLLVGAISLPMTVVFDEDKTAFASQLYWTLYFVLDFSLGTASLFGLSALAVERMHATYFPFKHSTLSNIVYILSMVIMWAMVVGLGAVSYQFFVGDRYHYILLKMTTVAVALVVIIIAYAMIFVKVRCMATAAVHVNHQDNKRLTTTLAIVTAISLVTWLPYPIMIFCADQIIFASSKETFFVLRSISKVFHYSNSLANVFICAFRMREFKRELKRRFGCGAGNQVTASHMNSTGVQGHAQ